MKSSVKFSRKKKRKSLFKRIVAWLHLWPSLVSGIIILFVCLTGTIIVYADEIMDWTAGDAKYIENVGKERISSDEIIDHLKSEYPGFMVSEFVFFKNPKRSIRLRAYNPKKRQLAMIYMNPYTGEILKKDTTIFFFFVMAHLHASLLAGEVGHWIVAIATIVFVIGCVTGLVLWWPKRWNKAGKKAAFTIKRKAKFKKLNYDLHNVLGFYALIPSFILGITGLMLFFPSFTNVTIKATGGELAPLKEILPKIDSTKTSKNMVPFAYKVLYKEHPEKNEISIWNFDFRKMGAYVFTSGKVGLKSIENADVIVYDRYTGKKIPIAKKYIKYEKTKNIIWQLHMGQWWGKFGKLITFLTGIIATSLSITGFLIWWQKRKPKKVK